MTWQNVLMIAGAIGTIVAGIKGVQYLFSLTPTSKLQAQVNKHSEYLTKDRDRLDEHDLHLKQIDRKLESADQKTEEIRTSINTLGIALATLINHEIDGNDKNKLIEVRDDLFKKFIER